MPEQHARVVHQIARLKVVGAVEDDVVVLEHLERVLRRQRQLVRDDLDRRVHRRQPIARRIELPLADIGRAVDNLPVQVARVDDVEVDQTERADAGRRQVHRGGRTQSAGADAQHPRRLQLALPVDADLRHDQVAAVALNLVARQFRRIDGAPDPPATDGTMLMVSPAFSEVCSRSR